MMISKRVVIALAAGSIALSALPFSGAQAASNKSIGSSNKSAPADAKKVAAAPKSSTTTSSDESAIRSQLAALAAAASSADAAKMASLWSEDATYVDEDGAQTKGRQELLKRFSEGLTGTGKASVSINPVSVKVLGGDAAWIEGTTNRQTAVGMEPAVRFTMLMRKQNGNWLISSAAETAIANKTASDHLNALDWIVGEWTAERGDNKVKMTAEWSNSKNFIHCHYQIDKSGSAQKLDSQIIGWDPTKEQIVSWQFGSEGGFGYGNWTKRGKQWLVASEGIDQSGSRSTATNVLSLEDNSKFTWQSIGRSVDGVSVPDTDPLTVQRASK